MMSECKSMAGGAIFRKVLLSAALASMVMVALPQAVHAQEATKPPSAEQWKTIQDAAKKEGKIVLYHNLNPAGSELLANAFREAYPDIDIEMTRLGSAPLIQRFGTEFTSGRNLADAVITFPDERIFDGIKAGWMTAWTPPELKVYPKKVNYEGKNVLFNIQTARETLVWNTQKVKKGEEPKEWADLADPKWKGKVGMNPPWRSVAIQGIVAYWQKIGLGDMATKLKNNNVRFFEGSGGILQAVIRGDVHVAELTDLPLNTALDDGAPVAFIYPKSGTTLSEGYVFVAKKAPHPNAGKVFANWLLTEKGQTLLQKYAGLSATRPGIPPLSHLPATSELSNTVDGLSLTPPDKQKQIVEHWRTVFGVQ